MGRLLIVSNRLPVTLEVQRDAVELKSSVGGLSTGLGPFHERFESLWVGWPGAAAEALGPRRGRVQAVLEAHRFLPVWLSAEEVQAFYYGFSNRTLWPLFHYFPQHTLFEDKLWRGYSQVNGKFAEVVAQVAREDDIIWVHDYHLLLVPRLLRERLPTAKIGFFLHIPFPSYELFRMFPWREELLQGMLGADLLGFHTPSYVAHFLECVHALLGYEHVLGEILLGDRVVRVGAFPMGIDLARFAPDPSDPFLTREVSRIRGNGDVQVVLSIDRMDYSKGIAERLHAFDAFLSRYPQFRERVVFVMLLVPSRTRVEEYRVLKRRVDELIGQLNGKHGTVGWTPIRYLYRTLPQERLLALYQAADVLVVTSLRDGMNLVVKEYVATKGDGQGMVVLSEFAGAAGELPEALLVNPYDIPAVAAGLYSALTMPSEEKTRRMRTMRERLARHDVHFWASSFLGELRAGRTLRTAPLDPQIQTELLREARAAPSRLILLDYDGTLVPLVPNPAEAVPDEALLRLLGNLAALPHTETVVVSGRPREALDAWLGGFDLSLVAEHGAWTRPRAGVWEPWGHADPGWKERIRPILERFSQQLPGAWVEEKTFTLAWHYRRAQPQAARRLARELKHFLVELTAHTELQVLEGHKVIEVKAGPFSKGTAVRRWLEGGPWGFILAFGDDRTDEDVFRALPDGAWTVKVGAGPTLARFFVPDPQKVREILGVLGDL